MKDWATHDKPRGAPKERIVLSIIVLLAFALRAYRLDAQALWWDESLSVYRATRDLATILPNTILIQNIVTVDTLPPLYFALLHFFVRAGGTTEFALRFFSLAANVATVPLIYALARRWAGSSVGVLAAFLSAISPFYVWYAQEARPYALVLFLSTLAVYALVRAFGNIAARPHVLWLGVYVLAAAAALYAHYYTLFVFPFHFILILLLVWRVPHWRAWLLLPLLPLSSAIALVPLVRASMAGNADTGPAFVPLTTMLVDLLNSFSVGITISLDQVAWIDALFLLLLIVGIFFSRSRLGPRFSILVFAFLLLPILGVQAASYLRPLYQNSRHLIFPSPAFYLGVAAGILALSRQWRVVGVAALAVPLLGATLSLNNLYSDPRFGKDEHRAWAEFLDERWRVGDLLILDSPHTDELYRYYASDHTPYVTLPVLRADGAASPEADRAAVRRAYAQSRRVWFLEMEVPFDDPDRRIEQLLQEEGVLLEQVDFRGTSTELSLSLYAPALPIATIAEIGHPLDIAFGGHLRLLGFSAPPSLRPGERAVISLFWQVAEPVGEDYAVSLRLVDQTGKSLAQWDAAPLGNRAGTSTWSPGVIMVDAHELPVQAHTPAGKYSLQVVPYHAATGSALGEVVSLGEISVSGAAIP